MGNWRTLGPAGLACALGLITGLATPVAAAATPGAGQASAGILSTIAGGIGGPGRATTVAAGKPCGVAYAAGPRYFSDEAVRAVSEQSGWLTTPAGDTMFVDGPYGDGGPATQAHTASCGTPAVDQAGNLVIPDTSSRTVRVVAARSGTFYGQAMTAGQIYTVAGDGNLGQPTPGGVATQESLRLPVSVTVDQAGNLIVSDWGDGAPSQVLAVAAATGTFYRQAMTAGHLYVIAGGDKLAVSGDGGPAVKAGLGSNLGQSGLDGAGNIVLADESANTIRVVAEKTGSFYGQAMTAGNIYRVAGTGTAGYSGDGGVATAAALRHPGGVAVDGAGNLVLADTGNNRIRVVAAHTGRYYGVTMTAGHIYTVAGGGTGGLGDGGPATAGRLHSPAGVALDAAGNVLVADTGNHRVRVVAAKTGAFYGVTMTAGDIYTAAGNGVMEFSGDGGPAARAEMMGAAGVAVTAAGVAVADNLDNRIQFAAAKSGTFYGVTMTAGDIYTVAGDGHFGYSGDGGPAKQAEINQPNAVAADGAGNLVLTDSNNNRIRVVAEKTGSFYGLAMTAGHIYTVAGDGVYGYAGNGVPATKAGLSGPEGVAVDQAGNLLVSDTGSYRIRVVAAHTGSYYGIAMTAGHIYTVAGNGQTGFSGDGGAATKAALSLPWAVAPDGAGNILIADTPNNRIRVVAAHTGSYYGVAMTAGHIYTVAGSGPAGSQNGAFSGDGGPAAKARMNGPMGVAVDGAGNLLIGDTNNGRVRVVAAHTGSYYGVAMTAGDIYTVAGDGQTGFSGGGPATQQELLGPFGVTAGPAGNVLFGDDDWVLSVSG